MASILFAVLSGCLLLLDFGLFPATNAMPFSQQHHAVPLTATFVAAAVTSGILGAVAVPLLRKLKAGQVIRIEGPKLHATKSGTPTMGGLFFVPVGAAISMLTSKSKDVWAVVLITVCFAAIGFMDDLLSLLKKHNYGLKGSSKLALQFCLGGTFFLWMWQVPGFQCLMRVPWLLAAGAGGELQQGLHIGALLYCLLTSFCFASMSNGVNLTDGLDGLAAGTSAITFVAMAAEMASSFPGLACFCAAMAGACMGFLLHNRHRASVFMGDTGSLALGAGLAAVAAASGTFVPLFLASLVFVIETTSVVLQVGYFQYTKRRDGEGHRLLKMAPLHHHMELSGFTEPQVVGGTYVAAVVSGILALSARSLLKL